MTVDRNRLIGGWFALWSVMVWLTVMIGGITRLTNSGLSITEWKPVTGVIPPIGREAWETEFAKYRQIPEYLAEHPTMDLTGFRRIYLWEYVHRLWARLVGLAFAVPLVVFWRRRLLSPSIQRRGLLLLVLVGFQAALGWFMVKSGLTVRTDVSHFRLAAHLGVALAIIGLTVAPAARLLGWVPREDARPIPREAALALLVLVVATVLAGALVAGLDAGKVYNEFPLMGGRIVPAGYGRLAPWWSNLFNNVIAVQFNHRVLAVATVIGGLWVGAKGLSSGVAAGRPIGLLIMAAAAAQFGLGLATLLLAVPIPLAVAHQGMAVILFGLAVVHSCDSGGAGGVDRAVGLPSRQGSVGSKP